MESIDSNLNGLGFGAGDPSILPKQSDDLELSSFDNQSDKPSSLTELETLESLPLATSLLSSINTIFPIGTTALNSEQEAEFDGLIRSSELLTGVTVLAGADVHLDFDETSGNTAEDNQIEEGNQFGTLINGASFQVESDFLGGAVVFDGIDDYVAIVDSESINIGRHATRSLGLWFKLNSLDDEHQIIYEEGGQNRGLNIYVADSQLYVGGWSLPNDKWQGTYLSTGDISVDTWHHVALVLDTESGNRTVQPDSFSGYLDGIQFGSGDGVELFAHGNDIGLGARNGKTLFHDGVGRRPGNYALDGAIADFQLYNRALSSEEVALLAAQDSAPQLDIAIQLVNDTSTSGAPNDDGITRIPDVTAQVETTLTDYRLLASFAGQAIATDITQFVDVNGEINLTQQELENVFGSTLIDGDYSLTLQALDAEGTELTSQSLAFTLDQTAPTIRLESPIVEGIHSPEGRLVGSLTDDSEIAIATYQLDGGTAETITVDADGRFNLPLSVTEGLHQLQVSVTDTAGNQTTQTLDFSAAADTGVTQPDGSQGWYGTTATSVVLGEENSLVSEAYLPVTLGQEEGSRTLSFDVQSIFDRSSDGALGDRLLVYLVDDANPDQTLLDMGVAGTPLFVLGETGAEFQPGLVRYNGTTVEIDTTSIADATEGRLVFQLLNFDGDTGSVIRVDDLENNVDPEGQASPIFPMNRTVVQAGEAIALDDLNISNDLKAVFKQVRFDAATGTYRADLQITNTGQDNLSRRTVIRFGNLPDGVEILGVSGVDAEGNPYINLEEAISTGGLKPNATSAVLEIVVENPDFVPIDWQLDVFNAGINQGPILETIPELTVKPGTPFEFTFAASDSDGDSIQYFLRTDTALPTGLLRGDGTLALDATPEEVGTYTFDVVATDGVNETTQTVSLTVAEDPIKTTRISGTLENIAEEPLAGVLVTIGSLETMTETDGSFFFEIPEGDTLPSDTLKIYADALTGDEVYPFLAEKLPLTLGHEPFLGVENVIERPIYLPPLDVTNGQTIDPAVTSTVTTDAIPGAAVTVAAGSLMDQSGQPFTETLSITEVPLDLTPLTLPPNLSPDMVVTIQPGEMVFDIPAPLSLPNLAGYGPGLQMDLWSINPETGDFDKVGVGQVSADGSVIETIEGGILNSSWHFFAPQPIPLAPIAGSVAVGSAVGGSDAARYQEHTCPQHISSTVDLSSGAVVESHDLVTYQSLGTSRGVQLRYDSLRADPRPIVQFGYSDFDPRAQNPTFTDQLRLMADLTIHGDGFDYQVPGFTGGEFGLNGGEHFWSMTSEVGDVNASLQADLSEFESGIYNYSLNTGIRLFNAGRFLGTSEATQGEIIHINERDSFFGAGWGIVGVQKLIEASDGSILLIDGDGRELVFDPPTNDVYGSPPGDFSTLEKLADGTFRRTMKDQIVYQFDAQNHLVSVTDRNGNQTQHIYENNLLTKIVDPVGLETIFGYTDGKVTSITDPANRTTQLVYDAAGNLIRITDPDQSERTFGYDDQHHMTSEIDKRGNIERTIYDFAGRAVQGVQKDSSTIQVEIAQTKGLYEAEFTASPFNSPLAYREDQNSSLYSDQDGNTSETVLDSAGQNVSSTDENGNTGSVERDENNLIARRVDSRGNIINFTYDNLGNLIESSDRISDLPSTINLNNLDGTNGFKIEGIEQGSRLGYSVSKAGDVNSDGISDIILGSPGSSDGKGKSYIIFGQENNIFDANFDLSTLDGNNGFAFHGGNAGENAGWSVSNAGDINNDGIDDVIIGAPIDIPANIVGAGIGEAYVLFGNSVTADVYSEFFIESLAPIFGFTVNGSQEIDTLGISVSGLGDVNDDGIDDIAIAIPFATGVSGVVERRVLVIFGSTDGFPNSFTEASLDGSNGFVLIGNQDGLGLPGAIDVSGAGDINGDGIDDILIGSGFANSNGLGGAGSSYVVFGRTEGFESSFSLSTLNGINGFTVDGLSQSSRTGMVVSEAGDINGDGINDLIIGAAGIDETYVVFGRIGNYEANFELSSLDGSNGFVIEGVARTGNSNLPFVSSAGDFDGDGFDDIIISAPGVDVDDASSAGAAYLVWGRNGGFAAREDISTLEKVTLSTVIEGASINYRVSSAGDFNNDGYEDLLIGIPFSPTDNGSFSSDGNSYVVFGRQRGEFGTSSYSYDSVFSQLTSYTDELGHQTLFDVDPTNGNILSETRVVGEVGGSDDQVTVYTYTANGLVDLMTDPLGRVTDYDYDSFGRVTQLIVAKGTIDEAIQQFEYDAAGNQTAFIDENGNRTQYGYDELNRLIQLIEADPDGIEPLESPITSFIYDAAGNVASIEDARGHETTFDYDVQHRQTSITNALLGEMEYEYDNSGNVIAEIDERGNVTRYRYDSRDRLIETINPEGGKTRFRYDGNNNLIALEELLDDGTFRSTTFGYDSRDRLIREVDAKGSETLYEYDAANNLTAIVDRNGNRTEFRYDELNRLMETEDARNQVSSQAYDLANNLISSTDELGRIMTYQYDNRNRLTQINHPSPFNAESVNYAYDAVGNLLSVSDELGRTTSYQYDGLNRQVSILDPLGYQTQYQYDANDNLTAVIDALGRTTQFTYDKLNRQRTQIDALGGIVTTGYDASSNVTSITDELNRTTTFEYDRRNLLTKVTDPLEQVTTTTYDILGRVISTTDALGNTTQNRYDNLDRLIETEDATGAVVKYDYYAEGQILRVTDAEQNTTGFRYDELYRLTERDTDSGSEQFVYDAVGNLIGAFDRNQRVKVLNYDQRDRLIKEFWFDDLAHLQETFTAGTPLEELNNLDDSSNPTYLAEYDYNAASELTRASDNYSTYSYEYDLNGRLEEVDNLGTPNLPNVVFNYDYNAVGDRLSVTDTINGQQNGVETFTYDDLSRVTSITQTGTNVTDKRVDFSYDAASQMTGVTRYSDLAGNNVVANSTYTFDSVGRLEELNHLKDGNPLAFYRFEYDDANRLTRFESVDGSSDFDYNERDELTSTDHSYQNDEAYSYDDQGNRTNDGYVTGLENRLLEDGTYTYTYDNEGNRLTRKEIATDIVDEYGWDHLNRLVSITTKDTDGNVIKSIEYTYDIYGRRILKVVDSDGAGTNSAETEAFVYDGEHIALVFDGEENQTHRYLHGPQIDQVLAEETADGEVRWALTDHQGSVRDVIDNDGVILNHITYDSLGNITSETDSEVSFRFSYTGREFDEESGQYFYRARYYDAAIGRFINEDPIGFASGDVNLFRYVNNSPLNYVDPSGLFTETYPPNSLPNPINWLRGGAAFVKNVAPVALKGVAQGSAAVAPFLFLPGGLLNPRATSDSVVPDFIREEESRNQPPRNDEGSMPIPQVNIAEELQKLVEKNRKECEDDDEVYRDFAHGTSKEDALDILTYGINETRARSRYPGGQGLPGSFHTVDLQREPAALQIAYEFGLRKAPDPVILVMRVPESDFDKLEATGQVFTQEIGQSGVNETVFRPSSFETLNRVAIFTEAIDPSK
ncbi:RHS repeat-associated core domain protein [[Leptolyngbya] sp. PCC 7376]|uniref:RHS repeat-associated core domain-containing protein n=1 Tax=[Leptolyngbya] sp. PCC 7376 TaxID=111781 RepID=UPI00029EE1DD|nr:RHS repeat-associated core domain-containing protein [[Leptolyngbya] sp. PCC 7376]AFY40222.1 RHS repeat-associated core domain protein [[Leptolyngbya] sp. PCC 7376]